MSEHPIPSEPKFWLHVPLQTIRGDWLRLPADGRVTVLGYGGRLCERHLPISYNIAPSQPVLAIRLNPETKQRSLDVLLWGLVPYWSKDDKTGFINARAERIDIAQPWSPVSKAPMFGPRRRLLRVAENARGEKFPFPSK
jgi:SOS response associated peptidase (SRAP)